MNITPDLSQSFNPQPKPLKKGKSVPKPINKIGKKTKAWEDTKKIIKPQFEAAGITECEIGHYIFKYLPEYRTLIAGNRHRFFLTWAHGDKRDDLEEGELEKLVCLACLDCHTFVEDLPSSEMRAIITDIISKREVQV